MTIFQNDHDRRRVLQAVAKEREIYDDLLTEELECTDSYKNLTNKVKAFLHLAAAEFPDASFVMVADDDIYLKADQLAEFLHSTSSKEQLYFGEVWSVMFSHKQASIRDSESQYYIPEGQYPMRGGCLTYLDPILLFRWTAYGSSPRITDI
ncbi:Beta-1,3-galactosyltransferase 4 [Phytophthora pseudosyringae]|uniref:Hexosyltransferase n=1 Tax=Phytophthora pseudosyringae TaxID=221518 RepID=A0A8T1VMD4_9STRA|nr:Beta-1,3-galactosyltransferase 4 [Phytophthora pseudosyringae]